MAEAAATSAPVEVPPTMTVVEDEVKPTFEISKEERKME